jgi:hypothetical protein
LSKTLVTLAVGAHAELLDIAMPTFVGFADRHGYDLTVAVVESDRPASWHKIPALLSALDDYDEALWLDADIVIADPSADIDVPGWAWQALVCHHTDDGEVPNCGVWLVRKPMRTTLQTIWGMTEHLHHPWWEQAALVDLLGYRGRPLTVTEPTALLGRTFFLGNGWNVHRNDRNRPADGRFLHATMWPDRAAVMRQWAGAAAV